MTANAAEWLTNPLAEHGPLYESEVFMYAKRDTNLSLRFLCDLARQLKFRNGSVWDLPEEHPMYDRTERALRRIRNRRKYDGMVAW